jgi:hypothetical protein
VTFPWGSVPLFGIEAEPIAAPPCSPLGARTEARNAGFELRALSPTSIEDVIAHLSFAMTKSDSVFLVEYIRWRMDHPIVK